MAIIRFLGADGMPLRRCPQCAMRLFSAGGIRAGVAVEGRYLEYITRLDRNGTLVDSSDGLISQGSDWYTACNGCLESLHLMTGVEAEESTPQTPEAA